MDDIIPPYIHLHKQYSSLSINTVYTVRYLIFLAVQKCVCKRIHVYMPLCETMGACELIKLVALWCLHNNWHSQWIPSWSCSMLNIKQPAPPHVYQTEEILFM